MNDTSTQSLSLTNTVELEIFDESNFQNLIIKVHK